MQILWQNVASQSAPAAPTTHPPLAAFRVIEEDGALEVDKHGIVHQHTPRGIVLLDATQFQEDVLVVEPGTVEITAKACACNANLRRIVLPEGLRTIAADAFRGCNNLTQINLPDTLEEIGTGAFCRTSLHSISLGRACTNLHPEALCTGPVFTGSEELPYASSLRDISVHTDNPRYCMEGGVLCQRLAYAGTHHGNAREADRGEAETLTAVNVSAAPADPASDPLEALLCPGVAKEITLGPRVARVAAAAFAGTTRIAHLHLHESLAFEAENPLQNCTCKRLTIDLAEPRGDFSEVSLEMPFQTPAGRIVSVPTSTEHIDLARTLATYDNAVLSEKDPLEQARHLAARLAAPVCLTPAKAHAFRKALRPVAQSACLHLGARGQWADIERLFDAGALSSSHIAGLVGAFNKFGNTLAAGFMLDLKARYFGKARASYDI